MNEPTIVYVGRYEIHYRLADGSVVIEHMSYNR